MGALRPLAVRFWRWFTGPASIAAVIAVALYLLFLTAGPPLLALWLILRVLFVNSGSDGDFSARLAVQLALLAVGWYLARRFLPPFRWRA